MFSVATRIFAHEQGFLFGAQVKGTLTRPTTVKCLMETT